MRIIIEATTVEPPSPPLYNGHFLADTPYIDSCLNLSTTATFFSPIFPFFKTRFVFKSFANLARRY